ncbi:TspO/MBR family protein [Motiliproteus sp. SC1-56]|uniref:TspO/MBR family protein n=1 Tax=Motiliproteus sp. SC1-56 TaxID=2799565 RepID=UPI001A8F34DE|nr:TspO/MBR family protein [Motiliproteus sp. SC1-56]
MEPLRKEAQFTGLVTWLVISCVVAGVGAIASLEAPAFYSQLARPDWAPGAGVFGPVWTLLFILMALAAWLVWRRGGFAGARRALLLYLVQLVFNGLWSWLFFAWHLGGAALLDVLLLWALILATLVAFWQHSRLAAVLLIPYWLWVSFAALLNYSVWQLNPQLLGG